MSLYITDNNMNLIKIAGNSYTHQKEEPIPPKETKDFWVLNSILPGSTFDFNINLKVNGASFNGLRYRYENGSYILELKKESNYYTLYKNSKSSSISSYDYYWYNDVPTSPSKDFIAFDSEPSYMNTLLCKALDFEEEPTGELLEWLNKNAVKKKLVKIKFYFEDSLAGVTLPCEYWENYCFGSFSHYGSNTQIFKKTNFYTYRYRFYSLRDDTGSTTFSFSSSKTFNNNVVDGYLYKDGVKLNYFDLPKDGETYSWTQA